MYLGPTLVIKRVNMFIFSVTSKVYDMLSM